MVVWVPVMAATRALDRGPARLRTGRMFRRLGRLLARVNPWRLRLEGLHRAQRGRVYVVVSNHQSLADIPVVAHLRLDAKWLAKAELFRLPLVGWMLRMAGDIPVERADRRKSAQALLQCARSLRSGCSVVFFPEGTRSHDGEIHAFNDGPFQLALREGVSVLPVVVDGSGTALPRQTWLFGATQDIYLSVLEPVPVEGYGTTQTAAFREHVRELMIAELNRLRARTAVRA